MGADRVRPSELFTPDDPGFLADPYPALDAMREAAPGFWNESTGQWTITRFSDVHEALRDRRLGRSYTPRYTHAQFGRPEPDTRWAAFHQHEAWSLLCLEPPDHTRIRRLVSKVFTPKAVAAMRPAIERFSDELMAYLSLPPDQARPGGEESLVNDLDLVLRILRRSAR